MASKENATEEVTQDSNNQGGLLQSLEDTGSSGLSVLKNAIAAIGDAMTDLVEAASTKKEGANFESNSDEAQKDKSATNSSQSKSVDSVPNKSADELVEANNEPTTSETPSENLVSSETPNPEPTPVEASKEALTSVEISNQKAIHDESPNDEQTLVDTVSEESELTKKSTDDSATKPPSDEENVVTPIVESDSKNISDVENKEQSAITEAQSIDNDDQLQETAVADNVTGIAGTDVSLNDTETIHKKETEVISEKVSEVPEVASVLQEVIVSETTTSPPSLPVFIEIAEGEKKTTVIETSETVTREGEDPILVETKTIITTSVTEKSESAESTESTNQPDAQADFDSSEAANELNNEVEDEEDIILAEGELDNITLGDNEYIVGEVVEVDDNGSLDTVDSDGKPKKKKKLRLFKKIKRGTKAIVVDAPKAVAYGALFSAGALVGGSIVGSKAIGHGAVSGTKAIGHGVTSGAEAIGHGVQAIGRGTKELAKSAANTIADGSRAGAEFVTDTGEKIVVGTKEFAQNVADGTVKVAKGTKIIIVDSAEAVAYSALYGTGAVIGGTKAIGHGVVEGTVKIAEGTKNTADSFAKASVAAVGDIVDSAKSGANAVSNTATRAKNAVEEKAREALLSALEATQAGAQFAGYGKDGKPLAIEGAVKPNPK